MTVKEFWHLKIGQVIEDTMYHRVGKVIKREVRDEICGFILTPTVDIDLKSGHKYLEITMKCNDGHCYYYQSNDYKVKKLNFRSE